VPHVKALKSQTLKVCNASKNIRVMLSSRRLGLTNRNLLYSRNDSARNHAGTENGCSFGEIGPVCAIFSNPYENSGTHK